MSDNQLTELPPLATPQLEVLDIADNQIEALPDGIVDTELYALDAANNQIAELPADFGDLGSFLDGAGWESLLDLSNNRLTSLPDSFGNLAVYSINLRSNRLSSLPDSIGDLTVYLLRLQDNDLTVLPGTFGFIDEIQQLNLSSNGLTEMPVSFGDMLATRETNRSLNYMDVINLKDNKLSGDITPWLERAASQGYVGDVNNGRLVVDDDEGGNNCLFVTIAELESSMTRQDPDWDRCE